ncbi:bifunctional diguanylate cyclase/phosphodiesterase [Thaumasiovibrio subtropicus]|uniref:bifunctional diguanylate cyclase/phosphodiesterase n=1 Tax=Thaumasiovibrio subtropicus TaxID=1891207 RepID=UPI000B358208|nr:GGDEF domain-containing protein [Thaumasiovibrio subtropicus]
MLKRFILFVFLALLPLLLATGLNLRAQYQARLELLKAEAVDLATRLVSQQQQYIYETHALLTGLSETAIVQAPSSLNCSQFLSDIHAIHSNYLILGVADRDGQVLCDSLYLSQSGQLDVSATRFFHQALLKGGFTLAPYHYDQDRHISAFSMAYPVRVVGEMTAVVYATISLSWWQSKLQSMEIPRGSLLVVADEHGQVIAIEGSSTLSEGEVLNNIDINAALLESGAFVLADEEGTKRLFVHQPLYPDEFTRSPQLLVGLPTQSVFEAAKTQALEQMMINLAAVGLFLVALWGVFSHSLLFPFRRLAREKSMPMLPMINVMNREVAQVKAHFDEAERLLSQQAARLGKTQACNQVLFEHSPYGVIEWRAETKIARINATALGMFAQLNLKGIEQMVDKSVSLWPEEMLRLFAPVLYPIENYFKHCKEQDSQRLCFQRVTKVDSPSGSRFYKWRCVSWHATTCRVISYVEDITASVMNEGRIKQEMRIDELTKLPNRHAMLMELESRCEQEEPLHVGHFYLHGAYERHQVGGLELGDRLICEAGLRLEDFADEKTVIARFADNAFFILFAEEVQEIAMTRFLRIRQALQAPYYCMNEIKSLGVTAGVCGFPGIAKTASQLVEYAEIALAEAIAERSSGLLVYEPDMKSKILERRQLEAALRGALHNEQLELHYQPIYSAFDRRPVSVEALLRWSHPELGRVSPAKFIPLAEESSLIIELGWWVLETAIVQFAEWQRQGIHLSHVAVNLSAKQFSDPMLAHHIDQLCKRESVSPQYLTVEMTEYTLFTDSEEAISQINALRQLGVKIALDDFGTGYSSLSYLSHLQLNYLKIDRTFVQGVGRARDEQVIDFMLSLAAGLDMTVVAEGVETEAQLSYLREGGCNLIQGYYFAKPMSGKEVVAHVQAQQQLIY